MTFDELYHTLLKQSVSHEKGTFTGYDPCHLDCLLHPDKYPPVWNVDSCDSCEYDQACIKSCVFDAIRRKSDGTLYIDPDSCAGCGACIEACENNKLTQSRDILAAMEAVRTRKTRSFALIAPAFLGQFSEEITPGKLRSAFKVLGFDGMVEVALFADILTMKEALEFDKNIVKDTDYQLTSCCCPMWIAMLRKVYHQFMNHVPGSVSPMIACGRVVKELYPDAVTVFIGPCIAKKSEAREADIKGAVDFVLTFQEVADIFEAAEIDPSMLPESEKDHSSRAGRIYARAGGVSEAVTQTLERLHPNRDIAVRARKADGVVACRAMLEELKNGQHKANFYEGMGCVGGCVGGPKAVLDRELGCELVNRYGEDAPYMTPLDNPYVMEILQRLGFDTVEELLDNSDIFNRHFN